LSAKEDVIEMEGNVEESLPNATFRVTLESGQNILAHLSGKMRVNYIKVSPGDRVLIEMSVYDLTKGRITRRLPVNRGPAEAVTTEEQPTLKPDVSNEVSEPPAETAENDKELGKE